MYLTSISLNETNWENLSTGIAKYVLVMSRTDSDGHII